MKFVQKLCSALIALLITFAVTIPVFAQKSGIVIDGEFEDWAKQTALVDSGGADDAKSYTDITEFRAYADSEGLYLLKAWDDTGFTDSSTAGITVRTATNEYYRIYTTADGDPGSVPLETLHIAFCSDSTCDEQKSLCEGKDCGKAGSGISWVDPFAGRESPDCSGKSCGKLDTAVELFIPWILIGGAPEHGQFVFLRFGSYPGGPTPEPYDDTGKEITCQNTKDTFQCYLSAPTAVTLSSFGAKTATETNTVALPQGWELGAALMLLAGVTIYRRYKQA